MRAICALGCLLGLLTIAHAEGSFQPAKPDAKPEAKPEAKQEVPDKTTALECVPVESSAQDRDRIYKIMVTLELDDGNPTNLTIIHVATSGKPFNRADQYTRSDLRRVEGKLVYYWTGTLAKDDDVTMKGTLSLASNHKWIYGEEQFQNGRKRSWMYSVCHAADED